MKDKPKKDPIIGHLKLKEPKNNPEREAEIFRRNHPQLSARHTKGLPKKTTSSPRNFSRAPSFLAKQHRPRANSAPASAPTESKPSVEKLLVEAQLMTLINQLHIDLGAGKEVSFTPSQLELFYTYCQQYSLLEHEHVRLVCQKKALNPYLYQQILSHLQQHQQTLRQPIEDDYVRSIDKLLKWYRQYPITSIPEAPDFTTLSHSKARQQRYQLLWQLLSKGVIDTGDFISALNGLCHTTKPSNIIHELNKLFPFMNPQQIGIAQIIVLHLIHKRSRDFTETTKGNFKNFCKKLHDKKDTLKKNEAYFKHDLKAFFEQNQSFHQSTLSQNIKWLQRSFQQCLENSELISFKQLFEQGIAAHRKHNRHEIASEIAAELVNASCYFYQSLPLSEFFLEESKREFVNKFTKFTNTVALKLIDTVLELDEVKFSAAIHLLVNVGKKLSYKTKEGNFADLNSLMILNMIFGNAQISKRIKKCPKILKKDRHFIDEVSSTLSCDGRFKLLKNMSAHIDNHLPCFVVLMGNLQFGKDGNSNECMRMAVLGEIFEQIYYTQQRIAGDTVFFNTTILTEILGKSETPALQPQPVEMFIPDEPAAPEEQSQSVKIHWIDTLSFEENLVKLEAIFQANNKPLMFHYNTRIEPAKIDPFLWAQYAQQIMPTNCSNILEINELERRLLKISSMCYSQTQADSHIDADEGCIPIKIQRQQKSKLSPTSFFSSLLHKKSRPCGNKEVEQTRHESSGPK